eukprot:COSAG06_NODE_4540_length_4164_cov_2.650677_3_plen_90_part_00
MFTSHIIRQRLEAFKKEIAGREGSKVRISLPRGSGQCLLLVGVVDEHDCLEAGQVLVNDGSGYMEAISVLVGRSPVRTVYENALVFAPL